METTYPQDTPWYGPLYPFNHLHDPFHSSLDSPEERRKVPSTSNHTCLPLSSHLKPHYATSLTSTYSYPPTPTPHPYFHPLHQLPLPLSQMEKEMQRPMTSSLLHSFPSPQSINPPSSSFLPCSSDQEVENQSRLLQHFPTFIPPLPNLLLPIPPSTHYPPQHPPHPCPPLLSPSASHLKSAAPYTPWMVTSPFLHPTPSDLFLHSTNSHQTLSPSQNPHTTLPLLHQAQWPPPPPQAFPPSASYPLLEVSSSFFHPPPSSTLKTTPHLIPSSNPYPSSSLLSSSSISHVFTPSKKLNTPPSYLTSFWVPPIPTPCVVAPAASFYIPPSPTNTHTMPLNLPTPATALDSTITPTLPPIPAHLDPPSTSTMTTMFKSKEKSKKTPSISYSVPSSSSSTTTTTTTSSSFSTQKDRSSSQKNIPLLTSKTYLPPPSTCTSISPASSPLRSQCSWTQMTPSTPCRRCRTPPPPSISSPSLSMSQRPHPPSSHSQKMKLKQKLPKQPKPPPPPPPPLSFSSPSMHPTNQRSIPFSSPSSTSSSSSHHVSKVTHPRSSPDAQVQENVYFKRQKKQGGMGMGLSTTLSSSVLPPGLHSFSTSFPPPSPYPLVPPTLLTSLTQTSLSPEKRVPCPPRPVSTDLSSPFPIPDPRRPPRLSAGTHLGTTHPPPNPKRRPPPAPPPPPPPYFTRRMPTSSALSTSSSSSSSSLVSVSCSAKLEDKDGHYVVTKNDVIAGTYTVIRQLGQGTFGKVAECEDQHTGQRVAIKLIRAIQKYKDASLGEIRVLKTLKQADPMGKYRCIQLLQEFTYRQHQCMVFPLLGPSLFDFLRDNQFQPFSLPQVFTLASQVLQAVAFLHRLSIVHTDLKPENIVLVHGDFEVTSPPFTHHIHVSKRHESDLVKTYPSQKHLKCLEIRLIDFGSSTFEHEYHSSIVSTRHYRAPEIILEQGWSFACDLWSVGCILVELVMGEALFQTHDNLEHLAMMEAMLGPFPTSFKHLSTTTPWFHPPTGPLKSFPPMKVSSHPGWKENESTSFVHSLKPLPQLLRPLAHEPGYVPFTHLIQGLLCYSVRHRWTAEHALQQPWMDHALHSTSLSSSLSSSKSNVHFKHEWKRPPPTLWPPPPPSSSSFSSCFRKEGY